MSSLNKKLKFKTNEIKFKNINFNKLEGIKENEIENENKLINNNNNLNGN
jgi:hypothetical protein